MQLSSACTALENLQVCAIHTSGLEDIRDLRPFRSGLEAQGRTESAPFWSELTAWEHAESVRIIGAPPEERGNDPRSLSRCCARLQVNGFEALSGSQRLALLDALVHSAADCEGLRASVLAAARKRVRFRV